MKVDIKFIESGDENLRPIIENETEIFIADHKINPDAYISFNFVTDKEIQKLNQKYRKLNQPTNVLSFPIWQNKTSIPKKGSVNLGDIFIFKNLILKNANESNRSFEEELRFIVRHSLNHLIGKHH